jgi:adenylate cyclase
MSAWDLVFRGMWHFHHFMRERHRQARDLFRRAIVADPGLAEGYIWLVRCINGTNFLGWSEDRDADLAEETAALRQALRLAESDPYALFALAIHNISIAQPERATAAAQRAIDLSPSFALGHVILGVSRIWAGRAALALEPLQRGLRLNPSDPQAFAWLQFVALANLLIGKPEEAVEPAAEAVALRPDLHTCRAVHACTLASVGRDAEAREAAADLMCVMPNAHALDDFMARFAQPTDRALFREGLRRAGWPPTPS